MSNRVIDVFGNIKDRRRRLVKWKLEPFPNHLNSDDWQLLSSRDKIEGQIMNELENQGFSEYTLTSNFDEKVGKPK